MRTSFHRVWNQIAIWCGPPCLAWLFLWQGFGGPGWDPHVPIEYSGDALFYLAQSKATLDHGWWWWNPSIGAPFVYPGIAFAQNANVDQAIVWITGWFTNDVGLAVNMAWLSMMALSAVTASWALRRLGVSPMGAGAAGVLFALSPFALYRNITHFNLNMYLVPFPAVAAVLLASTKAGERWRMKDLAVPLAGCVLLGLDYVYYAFFGSILIAAGTLIGFGVSRSPAVLKAGGLCLGAIVVATTLNLIPSHLAWETYGRPRDVRHGPAESEIYGLKIRPMISPVTNHPFPPFTSWRDREAAAEFPLETENINARIGTVAAAGWLALLASLIVPWKGRADPEGDIVPAAAKLSVVAVLVGTIGGFGSVFSLLVSSEIRGYNRIAPFIAFFALVAVAVWIDRVFQGKRQVLKRALWMVVLVLGLLDQRPALAELSLDGPIVAPGLRQLEGFVSNLEARLPDGAMVFQLPLRPYPLDGGAESMRTYDHFRPYLASRHLRWSYPVLSDEQYRWERSIAEVPAPELPARLAHEGFSAILINRWGYADHGQALALALTTGPQGASIIMQNEDYVALDLRR